MIASDVKLGKNVKIPYPSLVNLYGCEIDDDCFIGPFVEIQKNAKIGSRTRISSHSFVCEGANIGEDCFIAHGVNFVNDKFTENRENWVLRKTTIGNKVRIGSNATILPVFIEDNSIIGAGAVVTKNVESSQIVAGNPAKTIKRNMPIESKKVPFLDLRAQYESIRNEINKDLQLIMENTSFILGPKIKEFEENFARFCRKKYCIAVDSGTSALHLALIASGIKEGDEVILPVNTFFATAEAVHYIKAKPIFVDMDENYNINVSKIEEKITPKTKAILPVHLFGQVCDMEKIIELARKYNLKIIEDCCQAHGAEQNGIRVPITETGCFSFYPGKNLGAYGDAGAVITDNPEIAEKIFMLRNHGQKEKNVYNFIGYNYRMDEIQAAILNIKLSHLNEWTEKRRKNAAFYNSILGNMIKTPMERTYNKHVYHLYVIRVKDREELMAFLNKNNIQTGIHYPSPLHLIGAHSSMNLPIGTFPNAEKASREILSLPMYPELSEDQMLYVAETIKEFYNNNYK